MRLLLKGSREQRFKTGLRHRIRFLNAHHWIIAAISSAIKTGAGQVLHPALEMMETQ